MSHNDESDELNPPNDERVIRRLAVLSAITCRGFIENEENSEELRVRVLKWIETHNLESELEPEERKTLETSHGNLDRRAVVETTWKSEGLAILAWALQRYELPPHDTAVLPVDVSNKIDFLSDNFLNLASSYRLRSRNELLDMGEKLFAIHWRLRQFSLTPNAMDFKKFSKECWFGPLNISGIPLIDKDLSVGGKPICHASQEQLSLCTSIVCERHQAINWLNGYSDLYSETPTDT